MPDIEQGIYRALGVENIRHRREASKPVVMRRLLSLDFVLEHPGMNWLPAEPEKVEFFSKAGLAAPLDSAPNLLRCSWQPEALLCSQIAPCRRP